MYITQRPGQAVPSHLRIISPSFEKSEKEQMKLNYKRTFLVGFAFLSISAFWQMYDTIIPLICAIPIIWATGRRASS